MQFSKFFSIVPVLVIIGFTSANGQETIQSQFDAFYQNETSSWNEYKLIKQPKLKDFWMIVSDTLQVKKSQLKMANVQIEALNIKVNQSNQKLMAIETALNESETKNASILFLGIQMKKLVYSTMVWLIIFVLMGGMVAVYLMYVRNRIVTKEARMHLINLEQEYMQHKEKARETQTKLKRDMQTALNLLQENKIKF